MASLQVRADVSSAKFSSKSQQPDEPTIAQDTSSSIRTIQELFVVPNTPQGQPEPARKRRKVGNGDAAPVQTQEEFQEKDSIILAKVSVELVSLPLSPHDA